MTPRRVLKIFFTICFIAFVSIMIWDGFLYTDDVARNSITQAVIDYSHLHSWVPASIGLFMGALLGHFYL